MDWAIYTELVTLSASLTSQRFLSPPKSSSARGVTLAYTRHVLGVRRDWASLPVPGRLPVVHEVCEAFWIRPAPPSAMEVIFEKETGKHN